MCKEKLIFDSPSNKQQSDTIDTHSCSKTDLTGLVDSVEST